MARNNPQTVAAWHDEILRQALERRRDLPGGIGSTATIDTCSSRRSDPNEPNNKTKTIGFVMRLNISARPGPRRRMPLLRGHEHRGDRDRRRELIATVKRDWLVARAWLHRELSDAPKDR